MQDGVEDEKEGRAGKGGEASLKLSPLSHGRTRFLPSFEEQNTFSTSNNDTIGSTRSRPVLFNPQTFTLSPPTFERARSCDPSLPGVDRLPPPSNTQDGMTEDPQLFQDQDMEALDAVLNGGVLQWEETSRGRQLARGRGPRPTGRTGRLPVERARLPKRNKLLGEL